MTRNHGLGWEIVNEFKKRDLWGNYFTFDQYQKLKKLKTADEVRDFFQKIKFGDIKVSKDPAQVVKDIIAKKDAYPALTKVERVGEALFISSLPDIFLPIAILFLFVSAITWFMKALYKTFQED